MQTCTKVRFSTTVLETVKENSEKGEMNVVILSRRYRAEKNKCGRETSEKDDSNLFYPDNRTIARDIMALNLSKVFFYTRTRDRPR